MPAKKIPSNVELVRAALEQRPHSRIELEKLLGLGQVSIEQTLRRLRKTVKVYTVQSTRTDVVYELPTTPRR